MVLSALSVAGVCFFAWMGIYHTWINSDTKNVQMFECLNVQMLKYSSVEKYSNIHKNLVLLKSFSKSFAFIFTK